MALSPDLGTPDGPGLLVARQEAIQLLDPAASTLLGQVTASRQLGARREIDLRVGAVTLHAEVAAGLAPRFGSTVGIEIPLASRHVVRVSAGGAAERRGLPPKVPAQRSSRYPITIR